MRVGLVQLTSSDDPTQNLPVTIDLIREAAGDGARLVLTPEVTNCVSASRARQAQVLQTEEADETLAGLRALAAELGIWLAIGSLALKTSDADGRFANRSFMIAPDGRVAARYDKIHMFDVTISETERYIESAGFRPGDRAVVAQIDGARIGMTVCYDLRFPALYRALAQAGAEVLLVPAAFSATTGRAHWQVLLRARAIENGAFILAAAQTGTHPATDGRPRQTWGHSMIVDPWGEIVAEAGDEPTTLVADLDIGAVADARRRIPSLNHDRQWAGP